MGIHEFANDHDHFMPDINLWWDAHGEDLVLGQTGWAYAFWMSDEFP